MTKFEKIARNSIYFGPPGCGKSHHIEQILKENNIPKDNYFRVVFHPEYTHFDFVGSYRPVVGYRQSATVLYNGTQMAEPVTFYDFVPGPFALAITKALKVSENVVLVIEELNRGNCAAIFGSIFQLLDRDAEQKSKYDIILSPEWDTWHKKQLNITNTNPTQLKIPHNLWILATMNTSDQSLFPLDSAFKRRWEMVYMSGEQGDNPIQIPYNKQWITWTNFREQINQKILQYTDNDDKQLGMWFFTPPETDIAQSFASKVLGYVWHEIPPSDRRKIFGDTYKSFGALYKAFLDGEEVFIQEMELVYVENSQHIASLKKTNEDVPANSQNAQHLKQNIKTIIGNIPTNGKIQSFAIRSAPENDWSEEIKVGNQIDLFKQIALQIWDQLSTDKQKKDFLQFTFPKGHVRFFKKETEKLEQFAKMHWIDFVQDTDLGCIQVTSTISAKDKVRCLKHLIKFTNWNADFFRISYTTENTSSPNEHSEE